MLIRVLLNCLFIFFIHLKLEFLKQFPASNDKKYFHLWEIHISKIALFDGEKCFFI